MSHKPGGGIRSKNVTHSKAPKVEPRSKRVREPAVAQIGGNYGDHVTRAGSTGWRREDAAIDGATCDNGVLVAGHAHQVLVWPTTYCLPTVSKRPNAR